MRKNSYYPRDSVRDYFPLPNEIFSLGLTSNEISVYAFLMYCEDRKTYQCHPAFSTIGEALRLTKNTVMKCVRALEERRIQGRGADRGQRDDARNAAPALA